MKNSNEDDYLILQNILVKGKNTIDRTLPNNILAKSKVIDMLMKYYTKLLIIIFMIFSPMYSYALDLTRVYAYPVPFIPSKHTYVTIQIKYSGAHFARCTIYDINGDVVKELVGSNDILWNGRNDMGRIVAPGLYIIKIELEAENGEYKKKIIRILVQ